MVTQETIESFDLFHKYLKESKNNFYQKFWDNRPEKTIKDFGGMVKYKEVCNEADKIWEEEEKKIYQLWK